MLIDNFSLMNDLTNLVIRLWNKEVCWLSQKSAFINLCEKYIKSYKKFACFSNIKATLDI